MIYNESLQSKMIYQLNKEWLLYRKAPIMLSEKSPMEKVWCFIYTLFDFFRQYVIERNYYKKKTVFADQIYNNSKKCVFYEGLPKIVVYTCVVGGYDNIVEPLYKSDLYDYVAVTDFELNKNSMWKRLDINDTNAKNISDMTKKARYIKTHPHELFSEYDVSVYVDGNVLVCADIIPEVAKLEKKFFGAHIHPWREKLIDEAKAVIHYGRKASAEQVVSQVERYYSNGYNDSNKIIETTMLIRRHNEEKCIDLMTEWWNEIDKLSPRDQLSLPMVMYRKKLTLNDIAILGKNMRLNPRFRYLNHIR